MSARDASGRAWLPSSTGLPEGRPPTRAEAREAWLRQARGVYRMTCVARAPAGQLQRALWLVLGLQAVAGAGLVTALMFFGTQNASDFALAFHVVAAALLVLAQLAGPGAMAADAVAEVAAKSAQAWASSPLPTSAWVAGKTAYYLVTQAMASLRFLPILAASAALGGVELRQVLTVMTVGLAWTVVTGVGVASAALEPRPPLASRLAGRGGLLARGLAAHPAFRGTTPPAAALAVVQIGLGIAGAFMMVPFAMSGLSLSTVPGGVAVVLTAIAVISPVAASVSAFFPSIAVPLHGLSVPMWMLSVAVAASLVPVAVAASRLRWRAPDGSLGLGVRPASWLAWLVIVFLAHGIAASSHAAAAIACFAFLPIVAALAALMAGATRLPDLAADRVTGWRRVVGLDRGTAHLCGLAVLVLLACTLGLATPRGAFSMPSLVATLVIAASVAPVVVLAAATGREARRVLARLEAGVKERTKRPVTLFALVMIFGCVAPGLAVAAESLKFFGTAVVVHALGLVGPLPLLMTLGRDVLGQPWPAFAWLPESLGAAALPIAWLVQAALAAAAHVLERRAATGDDLARLPPVTE